MIVSTQSNALIIIVDCTDELRGVRHARPERRVALEQLDQRARSLASLLDELGVRRHLEDRPT